MIEQIAFYSLAALIIFSSLLVVTARNTVHSALFLGLSLAGVGGVFALLGADFLFASQILVYVGGIAVLIMFVVMLLGRTSDLHLRQINSQWAAALLVCGISLAGFWKIASLFTGVHATATVKPTTTPIGLMMMGDYALPFELVSLVLTGALLGAIFFSHSEKRQP